MKVNRRLGLGSIAVLFLFSTVSVCAHAHAADHGDRILFERDGNIYSVNADGTDETALTKEGHNGAPGWSPDGQKIVFVHSYEPYKDTINDHEYTRYHEELYVMNRDGSDSRVLRQLSGIATSVSWSPDGQTIGLTYTPKRFCDHPPNKWCDPPKQPGMEYGFYVLPADGQEEPKLVIENASFARWSPDGKKILFNTRSTYGLMIHIANADGSDDVPIALSDEYKTSDMGVWSPDGRQIAFNARRSWYRTPHEPVNESGIYIMNSDGTNIRPLVKNTGPRGSGTDSGWDCGNPSWSPDGILMVFYCMAMPACDRFDFRNSDKAGECIRRDFVVPVNDPQAKPVPITKDGGVIPEFAPR